MQAERFAEFYPPGLESGEPLALLAERLRLRRAALLSIPAGEVAAALGAVHARWLSDDRRIRTDAIEALHVVTGYAREAIECGLIGLFGGMDGAKLRRWVEQAALDDTLGPELGILISSGNIPGAALPTMVQFLLLRSPLIVKTSAEEPVLSVLYARSVADTAPELVKALLVTHWRGGDASVEDPLFRAADAVVAYGSDTTLRSIRDRLPLRTRFLGYGHRVSLTVLARESLSADHIDELARKTALDFCVFEQQGCLSPQAVYVERSGEVSPETFAGHLSEAFATLEEEFPRRRLRPAEAAAIHQFRAAAEMRALTDPQCRYYASSRGTGWTVVLDPDPTLGACPLNRTAIVHPINEVEALSRLLAPYRSALISAGLAAGEERRPVLATMLARAGFTRITRPGAAQFPVSSRHHDGVDALTVLARRVDIE